MRSSNQLRIVSGQYGGRLIDAPKNHVTQPMGERERNAIFNQIREYLPGAKVLDAFAGSGALGITALSNGAATVDFLEKDPEAIRTIRANLQKLCCENYNIIRELSGAEYDLIFADPPYDNPQYDYVVKITTYLRTGGILVLSHPQTPEPPEFDGLELISERQYAAACINIYRKA